MAFIEDERFGKELLNNRNLAANNIRNLAAVMLVKKSNILSKTQLHEVILTRMLEDLLVEAEKHSMFISLSKLLLK